MQTVLLLLSNLWDLRSSFGILPKFLHSAYTIMAGPYLNSVKKSLVCKPWLALISMSYRAKFSFLFMLLLYDIVVFNPTEVAVIMDGMLLLLLLALLQLFTDGNSIVLALCYIHRPRLAALQKSRFIPGSHCMYNYCIQGGDVLRFVFFICFCCK